MNTCSCVLELGLSGDLIIADDEDCGRPTGRGCTGGEAQSRLANEEDKRQQLQAGVSAWISTRCVSAWLKGLKYVKYSSSADADRDSRLPDAGGTSALIFQVAQ